MNNVMVVCWRVKITCELLRCNGGTVASCISRPLGKIIIIVVEGIWRGAKSLPMMATTRHAHNRCPLPPWISLHIPHPVNIIICNNTFIEFGSEGVDYVGLILNLNASERTLVVRKFLTLEQLLLAAPLIRTHLRGFSFWPRQRSMKLPIYLCDTDYVVTITVDMVKGLAFVFYRTDNMVRQLNGVQHTYCVSSCFYSQHMCLVHHCSFRAFPSVSQDEIQVLPSCFPSNIMREYLVIKNKLQTCMNTRSMSRKNMVKFTVENINALTWYWMIRDAPADVIREDLSAIMKVTFMESDSLVVQKWKDRQQCVALTFPQHLDFAKRLFGDTFGLGVRKLLCCPLGRSLPYRIVESQHQISDGDAINVIPFEDGPRELVRRGIWLSYAPSTGLLSVLVRFRALHSVDEMRSYLSLIGALSDDISLDNADDAEFPLHDDTMIFGEAVKSINFFTRAIQLETRSVTAAVAIEQLTNSLLT